MGGHNRAGVSVYGSGAEDERPIAEQHGFYTDGNGVPRQVKAGGRYPIGAELTSTPELGGELAKSLAGEPTSLKFDPEATGAATRTDADRKNAERDAERKSVQAPNEDKAGKPGTQDKGGKAAGK